MRKIFTVEEVAQHFGIAQKTVLNSWKRWVAEYGINPLKVGSKVRFTQEDIERLEESWLVIQSGKKKAKSKAIAAAILIFLCFSGSARAGITASFYGAECCAYNPDPACPTADQSSLYELERKGVPYVASWDYPLGTWLLITAKNGRKAKGIVLDRGPRKDLYRAGRALDLSKKVFRQLEPNEKKGLVEIKSVEVLK